MFRCHSWDVTPKEAVVIQNELSRFISTKRVCLDKIETVGGCDVSFSNTGIYGRAAICVFSYPQLELIEFALSAGKISFPYVPGLLSFREAPLLLKCYKKLRFKPDIVLFDGQGIAHPRRMGLATHMGILLNKSTIGCAKTPLYGRFKKPSSTKGRFTFIDDTRGRHIGACVRTRNNTRPLFVSCGHMIDLRGAIKVVLNCCTHYRIPEPLRYAHSFSKLRRRG